MGRPEAQISQWETLRKELEDGNHKVKWKDREPYAYWKGNSRVSPVRKGLIKCNVSEKQDWGALIYELVISTSSHSLITEVNFGSKCT